ncbi:hypothetical protein [Amphibacillus marinus]|nr:hypothetical protein [Amphibacillus marinus]
MEIQAKVSQIQHWSSINEVVQTIKAGTQKGKVVLSIQEAEQ